MSFSRDGGRLKTRVSNTFAAEIFMNKPKRIPLVIYFLLTYLISWAFMIPAFILAEKSGYALPSSATIGNLIKSGFEDGQHLWLSFLGTLSSYGPLLAALILSASEGRESLKEWWKRISKWHISRLGYRDLLILLLAIFAPLFVIGLVVGPIPTLDGLTASLLIFLPYTLYELLTSGMEEPGWRGYALPRLQERYSAKKSSIILGLIWGIWHWPAFIPVFINILNEPGATIAIAFAMTTVQVLVYTFSSILAASFIHTWLYNRTQGAFINILLHGGSNAIAGFILAVVPNPILGLVYGLVRWVVAIVIIRFFWNERLNNDSPD